MTRLVWDSTQAPPVKLGLDRGVLYFKNHPVRVWNGLSKVTEKTDDSTVNEGYYDGRKFAQQRTPDSFSATVEAFTYPDELETGDVFDLSYRVTLETGYEIHIVYNAIAIFQDEVWGSLGFDPTITPFSWDVHTVPVRLDDYRATAHLVINSNHVDVNAMVLLENLLYGTSTTQPEVPPIQEILDIFEAHAIFTVVDNGDGTWTATGPDEWFSMLDATTFQITTPSAEMLDTDTYQIRSW
jgi:hypothetical protein